MDGNEYAYQNLLEMIAASNGPFKLNTLNDTEVAGAKDGEVLAYDGINEIWVPKKSGATVLLSENNGYIIINNEEFRVYDDTGLQSVKHTHLNKIDLDKLSVVDGSLFIDGVKYESAPEFDASALEEASHIHANKTSLDKITVTNGNLFIDGVEYLPFQPYDDSALQTKASEARTDIDKLKLRTTSIVSVMEFAVKGDGTQDDAPGIKAAIAYAQTIGKRTVDIPTGVYNIGSTIIVPIRMRLQMSLDTVLKPIADINIVQLKPEAQIFGGTIDCRDIGAGFTKACLYLDGNDNFQPYEHLCVIRDINFLGEDHYYTDQNWTGTAIHFYSGTGPSVRGYNDAYVSYVQASNINISNFYRGVHLEQETNPTEGGSWITACTFDQLCIMNAVRAVDITGDSTILQGGHSFTNMQLQGFKYGERLIFVTGANSYFQGVLWDLHLMTEQGGKAIEFDSKSRWNYVNSNLSEYYGGSKLINNGLSNIVYSPQSMLPSHKSVFTPMPIAGRPNFTGNQDDYMLYGHKRGYTVTQTSSHPLPTNNYTGEVGVFDTLFDIDTEEALTWDMTTATAEDPIVFEINCESDPIIGGQFIGAISPYDKQPPNIIIDIFVPSYGWLTDITYSTNNENMPITLIETWASGDIISKIRVKIWGTLNGDTAQICRICGGSSSGGKAYLSPKGGQVYGGFDFTTPNTGITLRGFNNEPHEYITTQDGVLVKKGRAYGGYTPASNNVFYPLSRNFSPNFVGDQDDYLIGGHVRGYTLTKTSTHGITSGVLTNVFTFNNEEKVEFDSTNATEQDPITIEINLATDKLQYGHFFGLMDSSGAPLNVIVDVYEDVGPPVGWKTVIDTRSHTESFFVSPPWESTVIVSKIRIKMWGSRTGDNRITLSRVFAQSGNLPGNAWLPKMGGTMDGVLTTKGGLVLQTTTADPATPAIGQMWLRTDL